MGRRRRDEEEPDRPAIKSSDDERKTKRRVVRVREEAAPPSTPPAPPKSTRSPEVFPAPLPAHVPAMPRCSAPVIEQASNGVARCPAPAAPEHRYCVKHAPHAIAYDGILTAIRERTAALRATEAVRTEILDVLPSRDEARRLLRTGGRG